MIGDFFLSSLESFGFSKVKNNGFCGSWTRPISQKIKKVRTFWIVGKWSLKGTSPEWSRIGDWGELIDAGDPQSGNRFRLRFVFVSCVRASGRGEAVWACERGVFVNAGGLHSNISCSGRGCVFSFLLLCSWVFWFFRTDCWYAHWLFDLFLFLKHGLADPPPPEKTAICSQTFRNPIVNQLINYVTVLHLNTIRRIGIIFLIEPITSHSGSVAHNRERTEPSHALQIKDPVRFPISWFSGAANGVPLLIN